MSGAVAPSTEKALRGLFWKLLFRGRAAHGMGAHRGKKQLSLAGMLFVYTLFGALPAVLGLSMDTFVFSSLLHGYTFMFASLSLAANAGTMLFMREESEILLHRPITSQQLLRSKITVLVGFSLLLALSLNFIGLIAGCWSKGATWRFIPAHLISTVLLMVFSASCIVLVYNLSLKWFGRERLDNLLAMLQTLLSVLMVVSSQFVPRMFGSDSVQNLKQLSGWALALPPVWFGALDSLLSANTNQQAVLLPASFAIAATVITTWLAFGKLSAAYGEGLMALNENTSAPVELHQRRGRWLHKLASMPPFSWWLESPVEKGSFILSLAYVTRDREMKLRLYPGIAPMLIMPVAMMFSSAGIKSGLDLSWMQTFASCFIGIVPLQVMMFLQRSEHWHASSIFHMAPLPHWFPLFNGARKAVLGLLTYPILLLQALVMCGVQHSAVPLAMTLPSLIFLPTFSLVPGLIGNWLPLAKPAEEQRDVGTGCIFMAFVMGISAIIGGLSWYTWSKGWFVPFLVIEVVVMYVANHLLMHHIQRKIWLPDEE